MLPDAVENLRKAIRDVPDFPVAGIIFKDITPILCDGALFRAAIDLFLQRCRSQQIDKDCLHRCARISFRVSRRL